MVLTESITFLHITVVDELAVFDSSLRETFKVLFSAQYSGPLKTYTV